LTTEAMPIIDLACQWCGKVLETPGRARQHEPVCGSNPKRNVGGAKRDRWAPKAMVTCELCGEIYTKSNKSRHLKLCKKRPEPAPIDNSVPPGSDLETTVDELLARPRCATCADDQCGDQGKDLVACDDHEPAAMPECEGEACTIAPDPILDAPFAPEPRAFRESVPVAVMDPEPKPWSWPVETFDGRAATLARDNPESEHYRRPEVQEDVRAWLLRTLSQLSDDAEARGFRVTVTAEWPALRADIVIEQGARA